MAPRETRSNAPMPSTDNKVAFASMSVNASQHGRCTRCPFYVDRANWKGAVANWTASFNCWANVRATSLLTKSPTTIPRTPPVGFCNAVILRTLMTCNTSSGMSARANLSHTRQNFSASSSESNNGRRCSAVRRAHRMFLNKRSWSQLDEASRLVVLHIGRQRLAGCRRGASVGLATLAKWHHSQVQWGSPSKAMRAAKQLSHAHHVFSTVRPLVDGSVRAPTPGTKLRRWFRTIPASDQ